MPLVTVVVGRVGKPHGIRGDITVEPRTDEPDRRFAVGASLIHGGTSQLMTVVATRWHQGHLLLRLAEITDRNAAEDLRGVLLMAEVPVDEPAGDEADYWDRDLVGLAVLDHAGERVGVVEAVQHLPAQDVLEVRTAGGPVLVPFVEALVPEVDVAAGYVQLADVGGLVNPEEAE